MNKSSPMALSVSSLVQIGMFFVAYVLFVIFFQHVWFESSCLDCFHVENTHTKKVVLVFFSFHFRFSE